MSDSELTKSVEFVPPADHGTGYRSSGQQILAGLGAPQDLIDKVSDEVKPWEGYVPPSNRVGENNEQELLRVKQAALDAFDALRDESIAANQLDPRDNPKASDERDSASVKPVETSGNKVAPAKK